jgi:hypothetical protein
MVALDPSQPGREETMRVTTSYALSGSSAQFETVLQPAEVRMVLIAGGDLRHMEEAAVEVYRAGHIPILSEWFAAPLDSIAGSNTDPEFLELLHPIVERLLGRCDSVLRVEGIAAGADLIVALARQRGLRVYRDLEEALAG